jgi:hypothetical protein
MSPHDLRLPAALESALNQVKSTAHAVGEQVVQSLTAQSTAATRIAERDLLINASLELRRQATVFQAAFNDSLHAQVSKEVLPQQDAFRKTGNSSWQSLTLVDDDQVEEQVFANRVGQQIAHACEIELRELAPYMGAVLNIGRADENRNPLRPANLGQSLYRAIAAVTEDRELRKMLARELGRAMAESMRDSYTLIREDLQGRGVQAVGFSVKPVEGPGSQFDSPASHYDRLNREGPASTHSGFGFPASAHGSAETGGGRLGGGNSGNQGGYTGQGQGQGGSGGGHHSGAQASNAQLMNLLRRLTYLASQPMPFDDGAAGDFSGNAGGGHGGGDGGGELGAFEPSSSAEGPNYKDGLTGLMAVNLIRTHREELIQASSGKLDHMVIDVVGSLFDQILSDPKVPPQMARQIARLQLPVLRVALNDNTFFSSRKHPVRRFVNRIGSLACAYDDFESGPGEQLLARVRELVQEIVDGDFDQVELYSLKLTELESFIAHQTDAQQGAAVSHPAALLANKESELRIQQRYMQQLQAALKTIDIPAYLRDFLAQVWSQALVLSFRRAGPEAEMTLHMRRTARDLVMSVQPKGSPAQRKKFLMQLPGLMKDLKDGMRLIGWPEDAHDVFFADLLPSHAESLKRAPLSELDQNLLIHELDGIFNAPIPGVDGSWRGEPLPALQENEVERRFTPEEARSVGLVEESAVDWDGDIDIDLSDDMAVPPAGLGGAPLPPPVEAGDTLDLDLDIDLGGGAARVASNDVDISLDIAPAEPPEPSRGADLINHIQLGFAYQMHLRDEWQKVRLSFVSPARTFFVFTHGQSHQETISLTSRMLARMCESGRLRAVETAFLLERATARARQQLAALRSSKR